MTPKCRTCCRRCTSFGSLTILGIFVAALGGIVLIIWPRVFHSMVIKELTLTPDSRTYSLWHIVPIPIYMDFYLFNWTNPEEIYDPTKKPIVQELGPYVFREHREKIIHAWFPANNTVTYRQNRTWIFEPELSNGSLDDLITTLNVPAVTGAYTLRHAMNIMKKFLNQFFKAFKIKPFVTKTAKEFIFDGYKDPILSAGHLIPGGTPFDKFGWMYPRNGSADFDGIYNMDTSATNLGTLANWNYQNVTPFYAPPCGNVGGSTGELFPPFRGKDSLSIFSSDVCRRLELEYKEEVVSSGISGYRYWGTESMFFNKSTLADNGCFCGDEGASVCYPNGLLNVSNCKFGAPAFVSFPHFYLADPSYRAAVVGMNPQQSRHQFFLDLEPQTGVPLQVSAGFQINILLQPDDFYDIFANVSRMFFPMVWFKQRAEIDDEIGGQLRTTLLLPKIITLGAYLFISIGISLIIILVVVYASLRWRRDDEALYLVSQRPSSQQSSS